MPQAISALSLGSLINIYESGQIQLYEVAGFNVHGSGNVTLVRKDIFVPREKYDNSDAQPYAGSNLDNVMQAFESKYALQHRAVLQNVSITYVTGASAGVISTAAASRKIFAPSYTELTGNPIGNAVDGYVYENAHLPLYANNASRKKIASDGSDTVPWWARTPQTGFSNLGTNRYAVVHYSSSVGGSLTGYAAAFASGLGLVPAFVLPSSTQVSDTPTAEGGYLPMFYGDVTPEKPILLAPINAYREIDKEITFEWEHVINTGTPQTKADLQYSHEGGAWTTLATVTGSAQTTTIAANTLIAGNYRWRARTYNTNNVAGAWSDPASFVGVGAPAAPSIAGILDSSRPKISWQSVGQTGYRLQIEENDVVIHDTGETAGVVKSYTLPFYLPNGTYKLRLRVINALLIWSAWAEVAFIINVTAPPAPVITAESAANGVRITITDADESLLRMYLMREGVPVADITGLSEYTDYAAIGYVTYTVRAVDANENYADSNAVIVNATVENVAIIPVDDPGFIVTMRQKSAGQPGMTGQKKPIGTSHHYAGREFPVYTFSEFTEQSITPAYFYTTVAEWRKLEALVDRRSTVLYRDALGNKAYGAINMLNLAQDENMINFALTILRIDYVEEIPYAEASHA